MQLRKSWLVLLVLLASAGVAHAQGRTITGTLQEAETREPVIGATILVVGTDLAAISEADGSFTIEGAPAGEVTLAVSAVTYETQDVVVAAGQSQVAVSMALARSEEILIVGRAPQITRQNLANGASVVKGDEMTEVSSQTVESALQGRISGANIQSNSGAPGGGIQIKLRGVSTINGEASPLFVIDGVIVSNEAIPSGISAVTESAGGSNTAVQDNPVNRIADLNPNDIESIEVLKGPAAAALYGSKATNGVIIITTKRGRPGEVRVNVMQRFGTYQLSNTLGSRQFSRQEAEDVFGAAGAAEWDANNGRVFNQEELLAGETGLASETSVSLSGGTDNTNYYTSVMARRDPGIIPNTGYEKQSMRLNLGHSLGKKLRVAATANLVHSDSSRSVTNNDNASISHYMVLPFTPSFWNPNQRADGTYPSNPFIGSGNNPLETANLMSDSEETWRLLGSASANYRAWETDTQSVNFGANFGVDRYQQQNALLFPSSLNFTAPDGAKGIALDATAEVRNFNLGLNGVYNLRPASGAFQAATTVGFQYEDRDISTLYVEGRNLNAGVTNVHAAASVSALETRQRVRDAGVHLQQEVRMLQDRLTLLGAVLGERSSANGDTDQIFFYPKAAATYSVPVPETFPVELVRVRVAYGETGNKPPFDFKYTAANGDQNVEGNAGIVTAGIAGDDGIEPERQREIEGGFDVVGFDGRAVFEFTLYRRKIDGLILESAPAPSTGYTVERINGGALRNRGVELMAQYTPIRQEGGLTWLSRAVFSLNRSRITDLDVPAFFVGGFGVGLGAFRVERNHSATQIVGNINDGATVGVVGDAEPDFRMSFVNNVSFGDFELTSLVDWQQGSEVINLTKFLYDAGSNSADWNSGGEERFMRWAAGNTEEYVEDASFVKLREISVAYNLPKGLVSQIGPMDSARVSVSGRNLFTWTPYTGLDPEVSNFGAQTIARNIDVAPFPPSRSFWFSIEAGF
ncbi:SusC/RagA family TonB-linked outer membrane protein [Haliangium sp.]|uniref:SusC/RagA family TonB-linked outer membrane protein n=1 Tax=Haliangium sp. TaxID=2663208 RepID=UPI003D0F8B68